MTSLENETRTTQEWMSSPRFDETRRLYSALQVAEQRGSLLPDYGIARNAAEKFYDLLRELNSQGKSITTFGPYSPGQAVAMKRAGIQGIYLGGWATSAKGSMSEDPGADLASYPLSAVPNEAAPIVRALITADRNQTYQRARMTDAEKATNPEVDFTPYIIADADTGHGGDPHVRNLIRRFVEVGVPGYHIEDQRPGTKKCGHQGGKVLVPVDEQVKRLNAARFQLDVMRVPGIIVARTDAEAANLLESGTDERDQPFILGATRLDVPSYKLSYLAVLKAFYDAGAEEINGHLLYELCEEAWAAAHAWLQRIGLVDKIKERVASYLAGEGPSNGARLLSPMVDIFAEEWEAHARLKTYGEAVAAALELGIHEGATYDMTVEEWTEFASTACLFKARAKAAELGLLIDWDAELARTPEGYYQVRGGIDYAIAKSLAVAPFCDIIWMETKTANLPYARRFSEAMHAKFPGKMLAYNLSPSFNWDTTGMTEDEMKAFPTELGKLGYVFNFITYGGHQIDGRAAEDFSTQLLDEGMLALAKLQRHFRLLDSAYVTPQTLVGGPRGDGALMASSGRTATTRAMGKGSTQHQHLQLTEVPTSVLGEWLAIWADHYGFDEGLKVILRPFRVGHELLELQVVDGTGEKVANVIYAVIRDRRGRHILSVRDQNSFAEQMRRKRLVTLLHLWLILRYDLVEVHYVTPTEDNRYQCARMQSHGLYKEVQTEVGQIIVADINADGIEPLLADDRAALTDLIKKINPPPAS